MDGIEYYKNVVIERKGEGRSINKGKKEIEKLIVGEMIEEGGEGVFIWIGGIDEVKMSEFEERVGLDLGGEKGWWRVGSEERVESEEWKD